MKLSELATLVDGDPELMIEDRYGIPQSVVDIDLGVMQTPAGMAAYVLLETAGDEDGDGDL
jgi:hypothetical protein